MKDNQSWRKKAILIPFLALGAILIVRLFYLQIIQGNLYRALAIGQQETAEEISGARGKIFCYDKNTIAPLVINKVYKLCYAVPKEIENPEEAAQKISEIFGLDKETILPKLSNKESQYFLLKEKLDEKELSLITNANIKGIYLRDGQSVYYPQKEVASNLLGFVDEEGNGKYGIQSKYNDVLKGKTDLVKREKSFFGIFTSDAQETLDGSDIVLTLDLNIQRKADEILEQAYKDLQFREGEILIVDPMTGRILAAANYPHYDPNNYKDYAKNMEVFQLGAVQKLYEPGSVFKAVNMAIALDTGAVTPTTTYYDDGDVTIGKWTIKNYGEKAYGHQNMTNVLELSLNTGSVFAEKRVPHDTYMDYLTKFGFFEGTDIDIAGEVYSANAELKAGREIGFANCSFGQGISMTPLRLAMAYSALVNGGKLMKPYIVEKVLQTNGKTIEYKPQVLRQVIKPETSEQIKKMLNSVTEIGFSNRAMVAGYYIGGKTGTAQKPIGGTYSKTRAWHTFTGVAPIYNPRIMAVIKLDEPQRSEASLSAAPLFRHLAKYVLDYYQVPTERDPKEQKRMTVD